MHARAERKSNRPHMRMIDGVAKGESLYGNIARNVSKLIEEGALRTGDKLPSLRRASRQHKVSVTTAVRAYLTLENRGLIEARPKSGFFVRQQRNLAEPLIYRPNAQSVARQSKTLLARVIDTISMPDVVPFGIGSPSAALLPVRKLNRMLCAAARTHSLQTIQYERPPGCAVLRRALARRGLDWGITVSPDEIITTNGGMEALSLALRAVTKPGDSVAVESPTDFGVLQAMEQLGLNAVEIATHPRLGMCPTELESVIQTRRIKACLLIPNFNNPLGSLMPDAHKQRLVTALARREIPLIEDDLYGDLYFGASRPHVARSFDTKGLVILCGSFSKTLAPGYRVGWMMPGRFFEKARNLKTTSSGMTAAVLQLAIADYVNNGGYDHHLRSLRQALKRQVEQVSQAITETFPAETKLTRPSGGFVLWVELPKRVDALRIFAQARDHKVSVAPGPLFSPRGSYNNCIRLSCAHPWSPQLEHGISVLGRLVKAQML
jgi:DNA-binding transcriptional MocR family regulator